MKEKITRHSADLRVTFSLEHTCLVVLSWGSFPTPARSRCLYPLWPGFLRLPYNAISAVPCNASIRCHSSWGDRVNGCAVFPGEAGMDRPAFVSARRGLVLKLHPRQGAWEQWGSQSSDHCSFCAWPPALGQRRELRAHCAKPAEGRKMHLWFLAFLPSLVWSWQSDSWMAFCGNRQRLQKCLAPKYLCVRSWRGDVHSSLPPLYFWFGAVRHLHWCWMWTCFSSYFWWPPYRPQLVSPKCYTLWSALQHCTSLFSEKLWWCYYFLLS